MRIQVRTYLWWELWVVMGKLLRLVNRLDSWVRWQYAGELAREFKRQHPELVKP